MIAIIGILIAMLLPAIQAARESARRANGASNLKQLAIAVLTYADRNGEQIVPSAVSQGTADTSRNGLGWMVLLYPVMEKTNEYSALDIKAAQSSAVNAPIVAADRSPIYYCPTRGMRIHPGTTSPPEVWAGLIPDYVCVGVTLDPTASSLPNELVKTNVNGGLSTWHNNREQWMGGPIIPSIYDTTSPVVRSRVSIGGITDGMTYTALIGEKHLNPDRLGQRGYDNPYNPGHVSSDFGGGAKIASLGLAASPTDPAYKVSLSHPDGTGVTDINYFRYGSWHPGVPQFAFGDARVATVMNHATRTALYSMSHRADGQPYNLP